MIQNIWKLAEVILPLIYLNYKKRSKFSQYNFIIESSQSFYRILFVRSPACLFTSIYQPVIVKMILTSVGYLSLFPDCCLLVILQHDFYPTSKVYRYSFSNLIILILSLLKLRFEESETLVIKVILKSGVAHSYIFNNLTAHYLIPSRYTRHTVL